jgi:hypothetical protein
MLNLMNIKNARVKNEPFGILLDQKFEFLSRLAQLLDKCSCSEECGFESLPKH